MKEKRKIHDASIYDFRKVENKWRDYWQAIELYQTGDDPEKPKQYILDFFPYPSGDGLSVGHCRNYVPTCVSSRYYRMRGYNVLHPMGWDAFGLPAENYAIKNGIHPKESSDQFCATYRRQMKLIECAYDWSREINSTDPAYYRWTQWFFLLLYRRGLAYRAMGSQWWCPECQTILANEQVEDGRCWRCATPVTRKELEQWYFRITDYADRLLDDLEEIDWPESVKAMQRHWIGRNEGLEIDFFIDASAGEANRERISVFTTRPDTLFGVTFLVLAPEHPMAVKIAAAEKKAAVASYIESAVRMTDVARSAADKEKTGIDTGVYAIHPLTDEKIPIWVADYVLPGYGSGAIMGVPAHDIRDYGFAQAHNLPVHEVIRPDQNTEDPVFTGMGKLVSSGGYSGLDSIAAIARISTDLQASKSGRKVINYKMRDWLISRQRYWGAPIPIIHCPDCGIVPVPEEDLPVELPHTADFAPSGDGRSPLARIEEWVNTSCPQCGSMARRETDTMDGFACSSWYFLRFTSPYFHEGPFDPAEMRKWSPVDTYVGGAEHAVMHLLYARFWTKVMYDAGLITFVEPFKQLRNQGVMLSAVDGRRMSKSKGNVVSPDEVVAEHGADALRLFILFMGPFDAEVVWDDRGIKGITRFLNRYWRLVNRPVSRPEEDQIQDNQIFSQIKHHTIKEVTADMDNFRFNTAIATLMEYLNYLVKAQKEGIGVDQWRDGLETLTILLCPFAPFITEEVWQNVMGNKGSVHQQTWPAYLEELANPRMVTVAIQVNGRVRDHLQLAAAADEKEMRQAAVASPRIQRYIEGQQVKRIITIPGSLVNIVV